MLFLESIDRLIGQEHLFKRSIILVPPLGSSCTGLGSSASVADRVCTANAHLCCCTPRDWVS